MFKDMDGTSIEVGDVVVVAVGDYDPELIKGVVFVKVRIIQFFGITPISSTTGLLFPHQLLSNDFIMFSSE